MLWNISIVGSFLFMILCCVDITSVYLFFCLSVQQLMNIRTVFSLGFIWIALLYLSACKTGWTYAFIPLVLISRSITGLYGKFMFLFLRKF